VDQTKEKGRFAWCSPDGGGGDGGRGGSKSGEGGAAFRRLTVDER
jgi:hypothetical protein